MARIRKLAHDERSTGAPHPTEVDCRWQVISGPGEARLIQLSTYGSDTRQSEPKVSQTIQIDKAVAEEFVRVLRAAFDI